MSGFVIAHAYERRFADGMSVWTFMKIRLIRLYPLYILGTLVGAAVALVSLVSGVKSATTGFEWTVRLLAESFGPAVLLLPSPPLPGTDGSLYPLNAVAWSLLFEIIVNLFYVVFWRRLTSQMLISVMVVSAVGLLACGIAYEDIGVGWNWANAVGGFARVFYSFPAGVLLYRLWLHQQFKWTVPFWLPLVITVLTMAVPLRDEARIPFDLLVILFVFPVVTIMAVRTEVPKAIVGFASVLGVTSYAVYALHRPVLSLINGVAQVLHIPLADHAPWSGIPFLVVFVAFCWLVDRIYDLPVRRLATQKLVSRGKSERRGSK